MAMDHLHRAPHGEPRVLPLGDQGARLEWVRAAAGQADARAHGHRGGAQGRVHVADALPPLGDQVAADRLVEDRRARGQRGLHVHHRGQRVVLHPDEVERVPGAIHVVRDHHRHRLAHEAHPLARQRHDLAGHRQRRVRRVDRHRRARGPQVRRHVDAHHAGQPARRRHVDRADARVRVGRSQHRRVQAPGHAEIVHELPRPGDQPRVLPPPHRASMLSHSSPMVGSGLELRHFRQAMPRPPA